VGEDHGSVTVATLTIGGSEAAAACGLDPYRSRIQLWAEKTGKVERTEAGEAALWGTLLEPVIRDEVERRGHRVRTQMNAVHPEVLREGFMQGHVDGYVAETPLYPGFGILEIKTATAWLAHAWADDSIPSAYVLQVMHYLHLTGLGWGLVAALIGGQKLELRHVERDDALIELMLQLEGEFVELCETDTPPAPDGTKATTEMLARLYPDADGVVSLSEHDRSAVETFRKLRAQAKAVEGQLEKAAQTLKIRMGGAEVGLLDGAPVVRWPQISARRFDQSWFKDQEPALYEKYRRVSTYRRFTVSDA
jgi:putative phage-type endonuclease